MIIVSNNCVESAAALGKFKKGRCRLGYVDLSNNNISALPTPRNPQAFRYLRTLKIAGNQLDVFQDSAAEALMSLEKLDIAGDES